MAPPVALPLARELGRDRAWADSEVQRFTVLAVQYALQKTATEVAAEK
jgi:hypothetical protein